MSLLDQSATELVAAVQRGETTAAQLTDGFIARIEQCNPVLNALVAERFDAARERARALDAGAARGPLHGLPITIKEFVAVEGLPQTGGLVARKDHRAPASSPLVTRLEDAGAIVLGVTNAPELGLWTETDNRVYGRTNNPHDPRRTPGGSSGGEAALVGAGASPLGLGTDIGGSVRLPAFCCGVFAHKATAGVVPNVGLYPSVEGALGRLHTAGPIARTVGDLRLMLDVLAGTHPDDPLSDVAFETAGPRDAAELVVHVVQSPGRPRVSKPVRQAVQRAADALAARGATVKPFDHPSLARAFDLWAATMEELSGHHSYKEALGDGDPVSGLAEALRYPLGRSHHILPALVVLWLERGLGLLPASRRQRLLGELDRLRDSLESTLGDDGVLLYPPYPRTAPRHHHMMLRPFSFACTALFNALYFPATQVPAGRARNGMPLGVQVVGPRGADGRTLAVAEWLEADLGGWVRPTPS